MILSSLLAASVFGSKELPKLSVGQKWTYNLSWKYTSEDIDSTDEELFEVEVAKILDKSYTINVRQKLLVTVMGTDRVPVSDSIKPMSKEWSLFKNGAIAFYPDGRFALETRVFRIFQSIFPAPEGSPLRLVNWTVNFEDDGVMPRAALYADISRNTKEGAEFRFSYREGANLDSVNAVGVFIRDSKAPFPSSLTMRVKNTNMPGGVDRVDAVITFEIKKPDKVSK
jgi:hypothetical protein